MTTLFPGAVDSLPRPSDTTYTDDPGFELDVLIDNISDAVEAVESYVSKMARQNVLINGDFSVWQRGTSGPTVADNGYGPDRWRCLTETTSTGFVVSRESTDLPSGGSRRACKFEIGSSNNVKGGIFSPLEGRDIWHLRGQNVSLQLKLKVNNARVGDVRAAILQWTGTEDAISGDPITTWGAAGAGITTYNGSWAQANTPANLNPTTSWATYKIENVAISSSAVNLAVFIWIDDKTTNAGDYMLVTDVQLELGPVCTEFERLPLVDIFDRCFRYYVKTFPTATTPAQNTGSAQGAIAYNAYVAGVNTHGLTWEFPTRMRTLPTITTYNVSSANNKWKNISDNADSGTPDVSASSERRLYIQNPQVAGDGVGELIMIHATADAEL